jgi:hypothetical protein
MKTNTKHKPCDGRYLDDYVVDDGEEVRVPIFALDGFRADLVRKFGGTLDASDLDRLARISARGKAVEARDAMIRAAEEAWRGPGSRPGRLHAVTADARRKPPPDDEPDEDDDDDDTTDVRAPSIRARDRYVASLADAWRTRPNCAPAQNGRDGAPAPDLRRPVIRAPERLAPDDAAQPDNSTLAEERYRERCADLESAWRNPPGKRDPGRQAAIERTRELVHGGR